MRVFGRTRDVLTGAKTWWVVTSDANGFNDSVYVTALAQCLKLNLGESPFFGNYGIPAHPSIVTQTYPDFFLMRTQQQYSGYFASLIITPVPIPQGSPDSDNGRPVPSYSIQVLTNYGAIVGIRTVPDYPLQQPI